MIGRPEAGPARSLPQGASSPKRKLTSLLDRLGVLDRLLWMRARLGSSRLAVLTYHRVGEPGSAGELDPALIEVEASELEAQLAVVRTHCTIVSISDVRLFRGGKRLPPNPVLFTFDDGYADNYRLALPILRRAGVPATFFIPTAFPDGGKLFWWDRVWLLLRRCARERIELDYPRRLVLEPKASPEASARAVCGAIKRTPGLELGRLWESLDRATGVTLDKPEERALASRTIMSWSQIRELASSGMDVQSHSHDHLVLDTLTPEAAERDLARSSRVLEEAVGRRAYGVAYPVGYRIRGALRKAPVDARFELGFTNDTGLCDLPTCDPLNVPRLSMDLRDQGAAYKLKLLLGSEPRRAADLLPAAPSAEAEADETAKARGA